MSNRIGTYENLLVEINKKDDDALKLFKEFEKENFTDESALYTRIGYGDSFNRFLRFYTDPIRSITIQDLRNYKSELGDKSSDFYLMPSSANQHIIRVRKVLQFISKECGLDQDFYTIKPPKTSKSEIDENDMITNEELKLILKHATHPRDKALFSMLAESGVRITELLNIRIVDIEDKGTHINVSFGTLKKKHTRKKKIRTITLVSSQAFILEWLHSHPMKENPEAFFFIALKQPNYGSRLSYSSAYGTLGKISKRAGIRRLNLHLFRHTAVSRDVKEGWSGEGLNAKHGWKKGSRTGAQYTHLSDLDLISMQEKHHKLATDTTVEPEVTLVDMVSCPRCDMRNPKDNILCSRCFSSLSGETIEDRIVNIVKNYLQENLGIQMDSKGRMSVYPKK